MSATAVAVLAWGALIGLGYELTRRDQIRYRQYGTTSWIVARAIAIKHREAKCRIHKRGGMWFFRVGRFGGSFYIRRSGVK